MQCPLVCVLVNINFVSVCVHIKYDHLFNAAQHVCVIYKDCTLLYTLILTHACICIILCILYNDIEFTCKGCMSSQTPFCNT